MWSSFKSPWRGVWGLDKAIDRRSRRPRKTGITMVIDTGLGAQATEDLLDVIGGHVDHWKFGFGTSALTPARVLARKIEALNSCDILTYPGGTMLEASIVQEHCRVYMSRAKELGFKAVEISEGTISLADGRRQRVIDCALSADLIAITEVGRKDPKNQQSPAEMADQALQDLDDGASWVIVEGRESGAGVGIYDEEGGIRQNLLDEITGRVGDKLEWLIWEAPQKAQQAELIRKLGVNVNLGNIDHDDCLALEALRSGLRFETFAPIAQISVQTGKWDPAKVEPADTDDEETAAEEDILDARA